MKLFKWLLYIVAFSAFVGYVFFWPLEDKKALAEQANTDEQSIESEIAADETNSETGEIDYNQDIENNETTTSEDDVAISDEPVVETPIEEVNSTGIDLSNRYLIVVGSFGVKANANRMLRRVQKSGKDGVIAYINGLHRVVTASTDDESDAKNLRSHFTHIYKQEAFILKQ